MKKEVKGNHGIHLALAFRGSHLIAYKNAQPGRPRPLRKNLHKAYHSVHAEIALLQFLEYKRYNLNKLKFLVVRIRYVHDKLCLIESQPCTNCSSVLLEYKIRRIKFSTRTGDIRNNNMTHILNIARPSTAHFIY